MESAAAILHKARKQSGLSQRALADKAGVKQPVVARIESGRQQPSLLTLGRLLAACGYDLATVLEPLPDPHDLGLMETTLSLAPKQRIDRLVKLHDTGRRLRGAMRRSQKHSP